MTKLIIFTDLHMVPEGTTIIGLDPYQRLAAGIEHVNRYHADADRVIFTGDLTHYADRASYERLKRLIDRLVPPVAITVGNHDRREVFLEAFPDAVADENGFVQQAIDFPDCRAILLDTLFAPPYDYPTSHAGCSVPDVLPGSTGSLPTPVTGRRCCSCITRHTGRALPAWT